MIGVQAIFSYGFADAARCFEEAGVPCQTLTDYDALLGCLELDEAKQEVLLAWRAR